MSIKKIIPIICALAALPACTGDKPEDNYTVYIDPAFDTATQQMIINGLTDWQNRVWKSGHFLWLSPVIGTHDCSHECDDIIVIHASTKANVSTMVTPVSDSRDGVNIRTWRENPMTGHHYDWSDMYLATDMPPSNMYQIIRHEIGHALALQHTPPGDIMCRDTDCQSDDIVQADVDQFLKLRGE